MNATRLCMIATVTVGLMAQFACKKAIEDFDPAEEIQFPSLEASDPAGDTTCYAQEEDILGFEAAQQGDDVVLTITFDGDHQARFEAGNGAMVVVQFENKEDFIDSWIKEFEKKVVGGKAKIDFHWSPDGTQMIVTFEGDFTTEDIVWARVETLGCDEATATAE